MVGPIRDPGDVARSGAKLNFACGDRNCGCTVSRDVTEILRICAARNWPTQWNGLAARFRCPRCGSKAIKLSLDFTQPVPPRPQKLVSLFETKPQAMPLAYWRTSVVNPRIWKPLQAYSAKLHLAKGKDGDLLSYEVSREMVRQRLEELLGDADPHGLLCRVALGQGIVDLKPSKERGMHAARYEALLALEESRPEGVCGRAWRRTKNDQERRWLIERAKRHWGGV